MYDLIIVVPYRDRADHLKKFIPALENHLKDVNFKIIFIEQSEGQPFNRGKLLNIGYTLCKNQSNLFAFHDIDMIPQDNSCDYSATNEIVHLAGCCTQFGGKLPYPDYLGGVIVVPNQLFEQINGFNNDFWGWGIEDDDLNLRIKKSNIAINRKPGNYLSLDHEKAQPSSANLKMWNFIRTSDHQNGLNELNFHILEEKQIGKHDLVKVDIGEPSFEWHRHNNLEAFDPTSQGLHRAVNTRANCAVLVPAAYFTDPHCDTSLKELEKRGYYVKKCVGSIAIDKIRSQMATEALSLGFTETFWIDSDISFRADDIDRIRAFDLPMVAGLYSKKTGLGRAGFSSKVKKDLIPCGLVGGLTELEFAATGFLFVKKCVYDSIQQNFKMPLCNVEYNEPLYPYFLPMVIENKGQPWYLSEDFAFSERARQCGFPIYADTKVRLLHHGNYPYSWDELAPKHKDIPSIFVKADWDATLKG